MYPAPTIGLAPAYCFTAKPFYNLFIPVSIRPYLEILCAWWDMHATVVLHG